MLESLARTIHNHLSKVRLWTNVYGTARSILAFSTLLTLMLNDVTTLFRPAAGLIDSVQCKTVPFSLFCLFPESYIELAKWLAIIILIFTASGWRPRITAIPHWWVSLSLLSSAVVQDGGDQATSILTLFIIPIALTDGRKWHWGEPYDSDRILSKLLAYSSLIAIRVQVAIIYLHAFVGKLVVSEWLDGTVLFYWYHNPIFGIPIWLRPLIGPVVESPFLLVLTWGSLLLELLLFSALTTQKRFWKFFFYPAVVFHMLIAFSFGIVSFSITMSAALILYLHPTGNVFNYKAIQWNIHRKLRSSALNRNIDEPKPL